MESLGIILSGDAFLDLPPKYFLPLCQTFDQRNEWTNEKFFWTEVYGCLTRYFRGEAMHDPMWDLIPEKTLKKRFPALILNHADMFLALYDLLNTAWPEISKYLSPDAIPEVCTPGGFFSHQISMFALARIAPMFEGKWGFSPARAYTDVGKSMNGEYSGYGYTTMAAIALGNFKTIISICEKSKNPRVEKKLKEYLIAIGEVQAHQRTTFRPNEYRKGGQWVDGCWVPSERGKRHNPNPEGYRDY